MAAAVLPTADTGPVLLTGADPPRPAVDGRVGAVLAVLWLATSVAGYCAARSRRFGDHRRWMLRSVALTFSIVLNRFWIVVYVLLLMPVLGHDETALTLAAAGASVWTSWVVNLLVVEWWILRPRR